MKRRLGRREFLKAGVGATAAVVVLGAGLLAANRIGKNDSEDGHKDA